MSCQVEMINLEELVSKTYPYRQFAKVFDFTEIEQALSSVEKETLRISTGHFVYLNA